MKSLPRVPILLTTSVSLAAGAGTVADAAALSSPFRKPIWINEVRWTIKTTLESPSTGWSPGALVSTKMRVGRVDITRGFIPIWNIGTSLQDAASSEWLADSVVSNTETLFAHHRWILPKPLYVLPGSTVSSSFQRLTASGLPFAGNFVVTVSYAGSYAHPNEPTPKEIAVPFVACWQPTTAAFVTSGELDLANPFQVPLHVQRFVGRLSETSGGVAGFEDFSLTGGSVTTDMKDSKGYVVIKDLTTFSNAYDILRRAWTYQRVLEPKQWYTATVSGMSASQAVAIALIGWRNEVYA